MRPFQVWLGPLFFIKTPLETAQLLSKLFPFGLFLSIRSSQRRRSVKKKELLEISQNSQENNCARASFLVKLQALNFAKSLKACFYRTPPDGCFCCIFYFLFHKGKDTSAISQPSVQHLVYVFPIFFRFYKCFINFHLSKNILITTSFLLKYVFLYSFTPMTQGSCRFLFKAK